MLVINKTLVISAYIFGPSWSRCIEKDTPGSAGAGAGAGSRRGRRKMQTQRDRIEHVRERIAETSTALVKYLPPVEVPQYDISGKRIKSSNIRFQAVKNPTKINIKMANDTGRWRRSPRSRPLKYRDLYPL